ncbi:nuclease-related domain-containing DEAD/DEAH box helicase [Pseudoalteromonas agarivorans]|uniref:Uncharacterized protein n=1 Tax=Pseudoalteromonas agarivorans DSM 14585 TaxID=1312369 RepID=A0ACA8DVA0_9GAMM|nr:AAA family ATPase [Pseudoalteromonas agarivorans]ATC81733.1 hypothetical protein PAGA_a1308 [Pseudoalteromonas agarivorans DSM 14585]
MAKMYPDFGPKSNNSFYAEPKLYQSLKTGLSDEYTVIHSIPWLSSALVEIYDDPSGIGEVDFLVIHPEKGMLAIEVKGGNFSRNGNGFYYSQGESRSHFDPFEQLNRGVFAIQKILKDANIYSRLGKAYYFPNTDFGLNLPPEYVDMHMGKRIRLVIDKEDLTYEAERVESLMDFYKALLGIGALGINGVNKVIQCLLPQGHGRACWIARIKDDNRTWLKLTEEQSSYANQAVESKRTLVTGWPGSGKTIVLIHACRQIVKKGKRALVVTFNKLLSDKIAKELVGESNCKVISFNKLCSEYSDEPAAIFHDESTLSKVVKENKLDEFDTLLVDEGQAISQEAWKLFENSFKDKQIIVMCDDAQAFGYERSVSEGFLSELLDVTPYLLTESLRMPKAVCEELKLFSTPRYAVINKREPEKDTLHRLVTHDQTQRLRQAVARLLSDGIAKEDICVLKPGYLSMPADLVPAGVDIESIGRFRGLEKPVVIIYSSENISDSEFFCAYSRATSRCFVLLNANLIKKGRYSELGKRILAADPNKVDTIAEKGLMKNKIQDFNFEKRLVVDDLIQLEWCEEWKGFLFFCDLNPLIQELLISHLQINCHKKGIISWSNTSTEYLKMTGISNIKLGSQINQGQASLSFCDKCGLITPRHLNCFTCEAKEFNQDDKDFIVNQVTEIGALLNKKRVISAEEKKNMCIFLSAVLLAMSNQKDFKRPIVLKAVESANSYICQAVVVHTLYLVFRNKQQPMLKIQNKKVIAFVKKCAPSISDDLSDSSLAAFVADGINKLIDAEILRRVEKGVCEVILEFET